MGVPYYGATSMLGLAREKKYCNYSSTGAITGAISLIDLFNGGNSCGPSGENYDRSNDAQICYPHPTWIISSNKKISEWRCSIPPAPIGYCHGFGGYWQTKANLPACRVLPSGIGTFSNGVVVGGATCYTDSTGCASTFCGCQQTYEWNGSSWGTGGNFPSPGIHSGQGAGTGTSGAVFGGCCGAVEMTQKNYRYNGSSWSLSNHCSYSSTYWARQRTTLSSGFNCNAWGASTTLMAGGQSGTNRVRQFRNTGVSCTLVVAKANMNAGCREMHAQIGQNLYNVFLTGGYGLSTYPRCDTEEYNSVSWATKANMITGRAGHMANATARAWSYFTVWGGCCHTYSPFSGTLSKTNTQEAWNGQSWSSQCSISGTSFQFQAASLGRAGYIRSWENDCSLSVGGATSTVSGGYATNKSYSIRQNSQRTYY